MIDEERSEAALSGLYTCDLICWGVASPVAFDGFLTWLGDKRKSRVVAFRHRAKSAKWQKTYPEALLENGESIVGGDAGMWQRLWGDNLCRPSCHSCGFHSTERPGDVSIGDYWGLESSHPDLAFGDGASCLLVNSSKGSDLLEMGARELCLASSRLDLCANASQPMLTNSPEIGAGRNRFWRGFYCGGFEQGCFEVGAIHRPTVLELAKRSVKKALKPVLALSKPSADVQADGDIWRGWDKAAMQIDNLGRKRSYPLVFAAKNTSDDVRLRSSSGGVYHALAKSVIDADGIVYGCAFDENLVATHIRCETMKEAEQCMGSKYSQSKMGDTIEKIKQDLAAGRTVLFTGTPCQVAAVRKCCGNAGGGDLILADLICHGVPSPVLFQLQLSHIEKLRGDRVASYSHRPKTRGWGHFEQFILGDGRSETGTPLADSWRDLFYDNRMLRPSCYGCKYTSLERQGDVTIADFWGIATSSRPDLNDAKGVSLLLVNTDKGLELVHRLVEKGLLVTWTMSIEDALPGNPMLERSSTYAGNRSEPWEVLYAKGYDVMVRKMGYHESEARNMCRRVVRKAKRLLKRVVKME